MCGIVGTIRLVRGLGGWVSMGPIEIFEIKIAISGTWILASEILRRLRDYERPGVSRVSLTSGFGAASLSVICRSSSPPRRKKIDTDCSTASRL